MATEGRSPDLEPEVRKQRIAFIDASSGVEDRARDIAEARLIEEQDALNEKGRFRTLFKRVWNTKMHEYYRQKEIIKARQEIKEKKSLYIEEDDSEEVHNAAMEAVVDRFTSELEEDMVHAGEDKTELPEEKQREVNAKVKETIRQYAKGKLDDDALEAERVRIFSEVSGVSEEQIKNSVGYADNLIAIAKEARHAVEHGKALEDLDLDFEIIVRKARTGVRTEAQLHKLDNIVEGIKSSKFGRFFDETGMTLTVAAVYSAAAAVLPGFARSKAAAVSTFGVSLVIGAGFAAARENKRVKEDRAVHSRQRAEGKEFDEKSKRRAEMEQYRYETRTADSLIKNLQNIENPDELTPEQVYSLVRNIAEVDARIALSDRQKIDLISYSATSKVEQERRDLDIARAEAKAVVRKLVDSKKIPLKLGEHPDFDQYLKHVTELRVNGLTSNEITKKDKGFQWMKAKRIGLAAGKAVLSGAAIGTAVQEARAFIQPEEEGLLERFVQGHQNEHGATMLESLRRWWTGEEIKAPITNRMSFPAAEGGLPRGTDFIQNTDGTWTLQVDGADVIKKVIIEPDGTISETSKHILAQNGFHITETVTKIDGPPGAPTSVPSKELVKADPDLFQQVKRVLWYDNDTKAPKFDKNELKLWWGGEKNAGLTESGDFVMDVSHMMPKGSYHGAESVNAIDKFKEGNLKLLLSLSKDTQNQVVEVQISPEGKAIIPKDSEIAKLFFAAEDGKAIFKGQYAEVAQMLDEKDGVDQVRLLATHVGKGVEAVDGIPTPGQPKEFTNWTMDRLLEYSEQQQDDWEFYPPPIIPFNGRDELEGKGKTAETSDPDEDERTRIAVRPEIREAEPFDLYGYNNAKASAELEKAFEENKLEELKLNPEAKLDEKQAIAEYFSKQNPEYAEHLHSLSEQLGQIDDECRLSICIPVAGHQEGGQIYQSLENYTRQTTDAKKYEIVLYVNYPETDRDGNRIVPDNTIAEIERFKHDYPQMQIKVFSEALPLEQAKIGRIRKVLNDVVLLRQSQRPPGAPELVMVSNDADNKGLAPDYVDNFIKKFENNPDVDGFLGQLDWDPESYVKYPAIHIGTRLFQFLSVIGRRRGGGLASSGANFAFRANIYAGVGGYLDNLEGAEDVNLGRAIIAARGGNRKRLKFAGANVSRLYTSSRRAVDAFEKHGLAPVEQWEKGFSAFDDEIRKLQLPSGELDYSDPRVVETLKEQIEYIINRTLNVWEKGEQLGKDNSFYKKALSLLGVKYKLDSKGDVEITDMNALLEGLKEYQLTGIALQNRKSGKPAEAKVDPDETNSEGDQESEETTESKNEIEQNRLRAEKLEQLLKMSKGEQVVIEPFVFQRVNKSRFKKYAHQTDGSGTKLAGNVDLKYVQDLIQGFQGNIESVEFISTGKNHLGIVNETPAELKYINESIKVLLPQLYPGLPEERDRVIEYIKNSEIKQGGYGDCYLLAALNSIKKGHPELYYDVLARSIRPGVNEGDFEVGFLGSAAGEWISVTKEDIQDWRKKGAKADLADVVLERAYASYISRKVNGNQGHTIVNDGRELDFEGGLGHRALYDVLGSGLAEKHKIADYEQNDGRKSLRENGYASTAKKFFEEEFEHAPEDYIVTANTPRWHNGARVDDKAAPIRVEGAQIYFKHAYSVIGYKNGRFVIENPHDTSKLFTLSMDSFLETFSQVSFAMVKAKYKKYDNASEEIPEEEPEDPEKKGRKYPDRVHYNFVMARMRQLRKQGFLSNEVVAEVQPLIQSKDYESAFIKLLDADKNIVDPRGHGGIKRLIDEIGKLEGAKEILQSLTKRRKR